MLNRAGRNARALSLLIVWSLALGGLFAAIGAISPVARAGTCDQVVVGAGDWTINTPQVCSGIRYNVDGSININAGGSLTLINGGLNFSKDAAHSGYALNVNAGGALILVNSFVTTQTTAINPYLKLALTVSGANSRLAMSSGSMLKFPGWFNATGASVNITDSTITGFTPAEISALGVDSELNDDGPIIAWAASTTATLFHSRIDRIYQDSRLSEGGRASTANFNVTLTGGSALYAYDTFLSLDYSNVIGLHNELQVDGTSNAYMYNVTIDRAQDPLYLSNWTSAYRPTAAGGAVYLFRWLQASAVDRTSFAVAGAGIWSAASPNGGPASYPDNGGLATPSSRTLWYLGRSASGANAWNQTNGGGFAKIPLYTDQITTATLPNALSFGNYAEAVTYQTTTISGGASFHPYPAVSTADNNLWQTYPFSALQVRTGPDLELRQSEYGTISVIQNQPFSITARIYNRGQTSASAVAIAAYLNGNRAAQVARVSGLAVLPGTSINQSLNVAGVTQLGTQTIMLVADPDNAIDEGGAAQENNNFANVTLDVRPPPNGYVVVETPTSGQTVQPSSSLVVTGYVRAQNDTGILGVTLTIEFRSGTQVLATNNSISQDQGFFIGTVNVPDTPDGSYSVVVTPSAGVITPGTQAIAIKKSVPFLNTPVPILGLPYWLFFIILAAAAAAVIGVTLYLKVYGLGKMVECGECGAFIPEDATSCPKCGVEFEKDMAKCSNCQAWIPVDVKQCPECGVEFATGELETADYQEKMRLQYDEVVGKFKEEASRQLGRSLSDREFQEWWRKQPTFLTFEDWLREEEDLRKMGSKPCPTCGTLNSVTATVCHKCGSVMRESTRPPGGGAGGSGGASPPIQTRRPGPTTPSESPAGGQASPYSPPSGAAAGPGGSEAIPRRVIRKPITAQPVVQKKVVKKPMGEGGEGEDQADSSGENARDDEL